MRPRPDIRRTRDARPGGRRWIRALTRAALAAMLALSSPARSQDPPPAVDFNRDIRPVLAETCLKCHGGVKQESGMSLLYRHTAIAPAASGKRPIVPGKPEESELIRRVTAEDASDRMPPNQNPLPASRVEALRRWIAAGAPYDDHWAYIPPKLQPVPDLPGATISDWPRSAVDRFILARVLAEGLEPSPEADRPLLLRRLSLDLVGLPPSLEDVEAFSSDLRADAYERRVDRLLASARYGERWARMWLDLARYADTQGYEKDNRRTIWRFRDWVIGAFNRDAPFDEFTVEQLAGDLVSHPEVDQLIATAFHRNTMTNTEGGTDDEEFRVAAVMDRISTTWQVWMGTTFGCVQCHSHPYDPFKHEEYYQFFAFLNHTEDNDQPDERPFISTPTREQHERKEALDAEIAALRQDLETPSAALDAEQGPWEATVRGDTAWMPLPPATAVSSRGASLTVLDDGSVLAGGSNPANDAYTISAPIDLESLTALRLEALTDPSLPQNGPGRAADGNFVLSRLTAAIVPAGAKPVSARKLRIELPGKRRYLSLAEVQVFRGGENIATKGEARQSSTAYEGPARLAIDGNTEGDYVKARSTTHTDEDDDPWWELDLRATGVVDAVAVWNRTDHALRSRLDGFRIVLLGEDGKAVWETSVASAPKESLRLELSADRPVAIGATRAVFSQDGFPVEHAVRGPDLKKNGWAVQPRAGKPHAAYFAVRAPVEAPRGSTLRITLEHRYEREGFNLGRCRISAASDPAAPQRISVPDDALLLVNTPPEARSAGQAAALARYFRSVAPSLAPRRDRVAKLEEELRSLPIPTTPVLCELPAERRRETHQFIRGSFLAKGDKVEAGVPASLHRFPGSAPRNRLGLARWIVSPENPLTARVLVNRLWEHLFGLGIVETSEDFGTQGALPTHPELLDWLARRLMEDHGWSIKRQLREIVMSATYRQSSGAAPRHLAKDPRNRLLARGPRFRLEAEVIRDQALASSGLLSTRMFGPSVMPPQPDGVWQVVYSDDRWLTPRGDDRWRRGLYTFWRRTSPYPSMITFDATSRESCTVRRTRTNTPLQALVTLNDPVYIEAAQALARRMARETPPGSAPGARAAHGFRLCLCRQPQKEEIERLVTLYNAELEVYAKDEAAATQMATEPLGPAPAGLVTAELAAWTVVANVLLNLDEVLTRG